MPRWIIIAFFGFVLNRRTIVKFQSTFCPPYSGKIRLKLILFTLSVCCSIVLVFWSLSTHIKPRISREKAPFQAWKQISFVHVMCNSHEPPSLHADSFVRGKVLSVSPCLWRKLACIHTWQFSFLTTACECAKQLISLVMHALLTTTIVLSMEISTP